jgi:hypothetical protein
MNSNFKKDVLCQCRDVLSVPPACSPVEILEIHIQVAVSWVLISGKRVFENEEVSVEICRVWQRRFAQIGEINGVSEE